LGGVQLHLRPDFQEALRGISAPRHHAAPPAWNHMSYDGVIGRHGFADFHGQSTKDGRENAIGYSPHANTPAMPGKEGKVVARRIFSFCEVFIKSLERRTQA
jgi:hypothetical protein